MGYYTDFELTADIEPMTDEMIQTLKDISRYVHFVRADENTVSLPDSKWYDHQADMQKFSKLYPDILFILDGDGEESGDVWRRFFKNGLSHESHAITTYEPFDASRLS